MARLTDEQWRLVRVDYEVHGLSYSEIEKKHPTSKAAISRRATKENWKQGKVEHIVQEKVKAHKALLEVERKVEHLVPLEQQSIDNEVKRRLELEKLFTDSAKMNQKYANELLQTTGMAEMKDIKSHADLTAKNKETTLGKQPDTAIQINNNNGSVIDELVAERLT